MPCVDIYNASLLLKVFCYFPANFIVTSIHFFHRLPYENILIWEKNCTRTQCSAVLTLSPTIYPTTVIVERPHNSSTAAVETNCEVT